MMFNEYNKGRIGSFKLGGYSRGLPSWMAPKLLDNKREEEHYVAWLYARLQSKIGLKVTGVFNNDNDADKGADAIIRLANGLDITAQVTRFTLTDFLKRKSIAQNRSERIIDAVLTKVTPPVKTNVHLTTINNTVAPPNNQQLEKAIIKAIAEAIEQSREKLSVTDRNFINIAVTDEILTPYFLLITLQSIPEGHHSNFFGKYPLYLDMQFDNVTFSDAEIEEECTNIYRKKNGGQSQILLIWADTFEVLYNPSKIRPVLMKHFANTSFQQVFFFSFWNRLDMFREEIYASQIK